MVLADMEVEKMIGGKILPTFCATVCMELGVVYFVVGVAAEGHGLVGR